MAETNDGTLPALVAALMRRYAGVKVSARMIFVAHKGQLERVIEFQATRAALIEHGLIPACGEWGEHFTEHGTRIYVSRMESGGAAASHSSWFSDGHTPVSHPRSNPDNKTTQQIVQRILDRLQKGVSHG